MEIQRWADNDWFQHTLNPPGDGTAKTGFCLNFSEILCILFSMLLVIPAIEIMGGKCVQMVQGHEGFVYSDQPIEMAKLWRLENAKSLHVTDVDGAMEGHPVHGEIIQRMVKAVDIPIELGGGLRTYEDVRQAFDYGIYRVVLGTMLTENPDDVCKCLETWGPSKIAVSIAAERTRVRVKGWTVNAGINVNEAGLKAQQLGFKRIIYSDINAHGLERHLDFGILRTLAETTRLRVTASGGISGLDDLLRLQELEPYGVDSVIIGRALYTNKFSCQGIWRVSEAKHYPYTAKI
jgi:phosphoribosylformimino-5-aminoimidazole carboxamide ribotide isomerase